MTGVVRKYEEGTLKDVFWLSGMTKGTVPNCIKIFNDNVVVRATMGEYIEYDLKSGEIQKYAPKGWNYRGEWGDMWASKLMEVSQSAVICFDERIPVDTKEGEKLYQPVMIIWEEKEVKPRLYFLDIDGSVVAAQLNGQEIVLVVNDIRNERLIYATYHIPEESNMI